jgi:hypothetical protein
MTNIECPRCGCWTLGEIGRICKGNVGGWGDLPHEPTAMIEKRPAPEKRHPSEDGHWDVESIREFLFERDRLKRGLRDILIWQEDLDSAKKVAAFALGTQSDSTSDTKVSGGADGG